MDGIKSPFARHVLMHERETSYRFARDSGEKKTLSEINGAISSNIAARPPGRASARFNSAIVVAFMSFSQDVDCDLRCYLGFLDVVDHSEGSTGQDSQADTYGVNGLFHGYFSRMIIAPIQQKNMISMEISKGEVITAKPPSCYSAIFRVRRVRQ